MPGRSLRATGPEAVACLCGGVNLRAAKGAPRGAGPLRPSGKRVYQHKRRKGAVSRVDQLLPVIVGLTVNSFGLKEKLVSEASLWFSCRSFRSEIWPGGFTPLWPVTVQNNSSGLLFGIRGYIFLWLENSFSI